MFYGFALIVQMEVASKKPIHVCEKQEICLVFSASENPKNKFLS